MTTILHSIPIEWVSHSKIPKFQPWQQATLFTFVTQRQSLKCLQSQARSQFLVTFHIERSPIVGAWQQSCWSSQEGQVIRWEWGGRCLSCSNCLSKKGARMRRWTYRFFLTRPHSPFFLSFSLNKAMIKLLEDGKCIVETKRKHYKPKWLHCIVEGVGSNNSCCFKWSSSLITLMNSFRV